MARPAVAGRRGAARRVRVAPTLLHCMSTGSVDQIVRRSVARRLGRWRVRRGPLLARRFLALLATTDGTLTVLLHSPAQWTRPPDPRPTGVGACFEIFTSARSRCAWSSSRTRLRTSRSLPCCDWRTVPTWPVSASSCSPKSLNLIATFERPSTGGVTIASPIGQLYSSHPCSSRGSVSGSDGALASIHRLVGGVGVRRIHQKGLLSWDNNGI